MKNKTITAQENFDRFMYRMVIRRRIIILLLSVASILLYFVHIRLPLVPRIFSIEFSEFPELLLTFTYGPFYGVAVCVIKNVIHSVIMGNTVIPDVANLISETVFLLVAGLCSSRLSDAAAVKYKGRLTKSKRVKNKTLASLTAILAQSVVQFAVTNVFLYPMLAGNYPEAYSKAALLYNYNIVTDNLRTYLPETLASLVPNINSTLVGVLLVNIPITVFKLVIISAFTLLIYYLIIPLFFKKKPPLNPELQ